MIITNILYLHIDIYLGHTAKNTKMIQKTYSYQSCTCMITWKMCVEVKYNTLQIDRQCLCSYICRYLWMRMCGISLALTIWWSPAKARYSPSPFTRKTPRRPSPGSRVVIPRCLYSGRFKRTGEEECCHSVSLSACWAYSARQASLEWAKKQMAGDSISHQRENRSAAAHPPELHQPPLSHTHTHTSSSTPFNLLF